MIFDTDYIYVLLVDIVVEHMIFDTDLSLYLHFICRYSGRTHDI